MEPNMEANYPEKLDQAIEPSMEANYPEKLDQTIDPSIEPNYSQNGESGDSSSSEDYVEESSEEELRAQGEPRSISLQEELLKSLESGESRMKRAQQLVQEAQAMAIHLREKKQTVHHWVNNHSKDDRQIMKRSVTFETYPEVIKMIYTLLPALEDIVAMYLPLPSVAHQELAETAD